MIKSKKYILLALLLILQFTNGFSQGNALKFDGRYAQLGMAKNGNTDLNFPSTVSFTIEFWMRSTLNTSYAWAPYWLHDSSNWEVNISSGKVQVKLANSSGVKQNYSGNTIITDQNWHHVGVVLNRSASPNNMSIYVDGSLDTSYSNISLLPTLGNTSNNFVYIGLQSYILRFIFINLNPLIIDELKIFNIAKTATQIASDYASPTLYTTNLLLYHKFNYGTPAGNNTAFLTSGLPRDIQSNQPASTFNYFALTGDSSNFVTSYAMVVPKSLLATNMSACGFTANWTQPTYMASSIQSYDLEYSTQSNFSSPTQITNLTPASSGPTNSYIISSLSPNTNYYFRVRGKLPDGAYTPYVSSSMVTTSHLITTFPTLSAMKSGESQSIAVSPLGGTWTTPDAKVAEIEGGTTLRAIGDGNVNLSYSYSISGCSQTRSVSTTVTTSNDIGLHLDGTNDHIVVSGGSGINLSGSQNFTIETWIKPTSGSTGGLIFGADDAPTSVGSNAILFGLNSSGIPILTLNISSGSNSYLPTGYSTSLADGFWHHVAISVNKTNNTLTFAIDGVTYTSSIISLSSKFPSTTLSSYYIGYIPNCAKVPGNMAMKGYIDELRIWNLARSNAEITAKYLDTIDTPFSNLLAYYKFDQGTIGGTNTSMVKLIDRTGNKNHGTLTNFTLSGAESNWVKSLAMDRPSNLSVYNICGSSMDVSCSPGTRSLATDYRIEISERSDFATLVNSAISLSAQGGISSVQNLIGNTNYYVRAYSYNGENGAKVDFGMVTTNPCNFTWKSNASSSQWSSADNWTQPYSNTSLLPSKFDNVTINSGYVNTPTISSDVSVNNIYFGTTGTPKIILSNNAQDTLRLFGRFLNASTLFVSTNFRLVGNNNANIVIEEGRDSVALIMDNTSDITQTISSLVVNRRTNVSINKLFIKRQLELYDTLHSENYAINLLSDSAVTCRIGNVSGTTFYSGLYLAQLYIPGGKRAFRFLAHPFSVNISSRSSLHTSMYITGAGGSSNGFDQSTLNNPSAFSYSNASGWAAWTNIGAGGINSFWTNKTGLRILVRGDRNQPDVLTNTPSSPKAVNIKMYGSKFNDGSNPTITLSKTDTNSFNLIANPLYSNINLNNCSRTNVGNTVYLWNVNIGVRGAYTSFDLSSETVVIPSFTSFFATHSGSVGTSASIAFPESCKTNDSPTVSFRKSALDKIHIELSNDTGIVWDNVQIHFQANAKNGDDELDGIKLSNPDVNFYSINENNTQLSIDKRELVDQMIPLMIEQLPVGNYQFNFSKTTLPSGVGMFLKDGNSLTPINADLIYRFTNDQEGATINRFFIIVSRSTNSILENNNNLEIILAPNPAENSFKILGLEQLTEPVKVELIDVTGKIVYSSNWDAHSTIDCSHFTQGIYICKVVTQQGILSKKLSIKKNQ